MPVVATPSSTIVVAIIVVATEPTTVLTTVAAALLLLLLLVLSTALRMASKSAESRSVLRLLTVHLVAHGGWVATVSLLALTLGGGKSALASRICSRTRTKANLTRRGARSTLDL